MKITNQKINLAILPAYQFFAIKERYRGTQYKKISLMIANEFNVNIPEGTIKYWFYKKGPLKDFYRKYADDMIDIEIEEARDFIKGNVSKAAKILAQVMVGNGDSAQVSAAKEFLERGLGKVKEEHEHKVEANITLGVFDILRILEQKDLNKQNDGSTGKNQNNSDSAG